MQREVLGRKNQGSGSFKSSQRLEFLDFPGFRISFRKKRTQGRNTRTFNQQQYFSGANAQILENLS